MLELEPQRACRLSGEPLEGAQVLLDVDECPLPGIYPTSAAESRSLRSALRVVVAPESGLVQLAHRFDPAMYSEYGFAGDTSDAYRRHIAWFAGEVAGRFEPATPVLEVGCGDGLLLELLDRRGFVDRLGIDPGRAAAECGRADVICGFFPEDLPQAMRGKRFGLIVMRHVLEHIENPRSIVDYLAAHLLPGGELWIEVPDLDSAMDRGLWSNFYQLHCNYFSAQTLDRLAGASGLGCVGGTTVEVFGGSLLRRYRGGADATHTLPPPAAQAVSAAGFEAFRARLRSLAGELPSGAAGYGAAERTAMALGIAPELAARLDAIYDGNALLGGRYLAGTELPIRAREDLFDARPPAVVLFAVSHREEILAGWRERLPGDTLVAIAAGECPMGRLDSFPAL